MKRRRSSPEKATYTLAEHEIELAAFQRLVDLLLPVKKDEIKLRKIDNNGKSLFNFVFTNYHGKIYYFELYLPDDESRKMLIQCNPKMKILDSSKFKGGIYQGNGHIQASGERFLKEFIGLAKAQGSWEEVDSN